MQKCSPKYLQMNQIKSHDAREYQVLNVCIKNMALSTYDFPPIRFFMYRLYHH